jgi:MFS family permease
VFGYLAVVLGVELRRRGLSAVLAGVVLSAFVGGATLSLIAVRRYGDRLGRRRVYFAGYVVQAAAGVVLTVSSSWWLMALVGLSGSLSAEVVDASPFGALEQVMIASTVEGHRQLRSFGWTGAVGAAAGSLGALAAGLVDLTGKHVGTGPIFLPVIACAVIGAVCARRLSVAVEPWAGTSPARSVRQPAASAGRAGSTGAVVRRLSALFALDSFGAGFTVQAFVAYWLQARYGAGPLAIGSIFFAVGILHSVSMGIAARLGERFGMLATMVFTHLPSNGFLVALAFAPSLPVAGVLLCLRAASAEMDVPTRQA